MVYALGVLQFLIISIICVYELNNKSPVIFLWATLFVMFGVMHLITSFSNYTLYSIDIINEASLFVILFCFIYLTIRIAFRQNKYHINFSKLFNEKSRIMPSSYYQKILLVIVSIAVLVIIYANYRYAGGLLFTSWASVRGYQSSLDYLNYYRIVRIVITIFSGIILLNLIKKEKITVIYLIVLYAALAIITRKRVDVLPLLVSVISLYILYYFKKISFKNIIIILVTAIGVIYIIYSLRVFRWYGTIESFITNGSLADIVNQISVWIMVDNGELGLRNVFYYFIDNNNDFTNFGQGHTYLRMLLVFIPTQWSLGIKPPDFAHAMGAAIGMASGGSTHPTLFGDCYANLGWFGIFLGAFWAIYANLADNIILNRKSFLCSVLLYTLFAMGYIIIGRGSVYNGFISVAYGTLLIIICEYLKHHIRI